MLEWYEKRKLTKIDEDDAENSVEDFDCSDTTNAGEFEKDCCNIKQMCEEVQDEGFEYFKHCSKEKNALNVKMVQVFSRWGAKSICIFQKKGRIKRGNETNKASSQTCG